MASDVGVPCIMEDEYHTDFSGFTEAEIVISTAGECSIGVCVVNHFQGRVSCPEGQEEGESGCETPDGAPVTVPVAAQLAGTGADESVFCSCRCDGDGSGPFCECPGGFACEPLIENLGPGLGEVAGSYCVPD